MWFKFIKIKPDMFSNFDTLPILILFMGGNNAGGNFPRVADFREVVLKEKFSCVNFLGRGGATLKDAVFQWG